VSDPSLDVAERAVADVAAALGVKVDALLVAQLAGMVVGVLSGKKWSDAERAGLERASNITSIEAAEAAARARR